MLARMELLDEWRPKRSINLTGVRLAVGLSMLFAGWLCLRLIIRPTWLAWSSASEVITLFEFGSALTLIVLWWVLLGRRDRQPAVPEAAVPSPSDTLPVPQLSREAIMALKPSEFEAYVGRLFAKKGYKVTQRGRAGDLGVDLVVDKNGRQAIVQCKRYKNTVGAGVVRELYGTLLHEKVSHAFLVTSADISPAARQWARRKPMTLIDGKALAEIAIALAD